MYLWPLAKQKQAEFCPRFPNLLKFLLWTKGIELVKVLNALGPLCLFFVSLLFCSRVQNFCCRFLFVWYCLFYAVGWQSASLLDAKRPCSSSMLFVKLMFEVDWLFFPELNILDRVADAGRPYTSTMAAFDSGTLMNNGRTEGSTSTDDLKSNLWNIHITKKSPFHQLQKGKASLTSAI